MKTNGVKFQITDSKVTVFGYPELENRTGTLRGDDMAFFTGKIKSYISPTRQRERFASSLLAAVCWWMIATSTLKPLKRNARTVSAMPGTRLSVMPA